MTADHATAEARDENERVSAAVRRPPRPFWLGLAGIAAVLGVHEAVSRLELLRPEFFPPVSVIAPALLELLPTAQLWEQILGTLQGWGVGLALAAVLAVPLGMLIGSFEAVRRMLRVIVEFMRPIPSVALFPAALLLLGITTGMKVSLVAFAAFWPILFQAIYGVQDVDPATKETARAYGLGPVARFWRIIVPSTSAYIATGLRISSAIALILTVTVELLTNLTGLGNAIGSARTAGQFPQMYALIALTGILGWLLNGTFERVEARLLHWHPSQREGT
ncbi:ABC transporter permease [Egibacter rhizosphaerae]|uniref:ABC transporter permease n=2 Tax=Egibacter rhizosphaerae TaxID=1670831 RepID=A0A411YHX1_9ACTN|nr:ABC transporter permease [Egibacter rhizosphaerae]